MQVGYYNVDFLKVNASMLKQCLNQKIIWM